MLVELMAVVYLTREVQKLPIVGKIISRAKKECQIAVENRKAAANVAKTETV